MLHAFSRLKSVGACSHLVTYKPFSQMTFFVLVLISGFHFVVLERSSTKKLMNSLQICQKTRHIYQKRRRKRSINPQLSPRSLPQWPQHKQGLSWRKMKVKMMSRQTTEVSFSTRTDRIKFSVTGNCNSGVLCRWSGAWCVMVSVRPIWIFFPIQFFRLFILEILIFHFRFFPPLPFWWLNHDAYLIHYLIQIFH